MRTRTKSRRIPPDVHAAALRFLGALAAVTVLTGCTRSSGNRVVSMSPTVPTSASVVSATATPSPSASASPLLPGNCAELAPLQRVEEALGVNLLGDVTYLRAAPVPQSGRTGRVTCGYGTPVTTPSGGTPTPSGRPLVELSYITYVDAKTAADRVTLTVHTDSQHATTTQVQVDGKPAWVLVGSDWDELVMADGARTIVAEVSPRILAPEKAPAVLTRLAAQMLAFGASMSPGASGAASSG